ncbi:MAG: penicillin-binding protein activator LpoB [Bacteroidetes bacterium]|nr:penicillin-binding protein activator LpoB [Bacteroidota bacterium]
MKKIILSASLILALVVTGCQRKVTRVEPEKQIDLSGRWNDVDSRMVADEMIKQVLGEKWLSDYMQANGGKKPVVIVGFVKNKSHEQIEAEVFMKDIEKSFIKSNQVRLVQGGEKREQVRGERADQQDNSSQSTMKKWGLEIGADFMMQGTINSVVDSYKRDKVVFYKTNLELTNIQTNEIVWIGDKEIKKTVKN